MALQRVHISSQEPIIDPKNNVCLCEKLIILVSFERLDHDESELLKFSAFKNFAAPSRTLMRLPYCECLLKISAENGTS